MTNTPSAGQGLGYFVVFWSNSTNRETPSVSGGLDIVIVGPVEDIHRGDARYVWVGARAGADVAIKPGFASAFHECDGCFSYVVQERALDEIYIGSDRVGLGPIYYTETEHGLVCSNSLSELKNRMKMVEPDWVQWGVLYQLGDIPGRGTVLKNVFRLGVGERIVINHSGWRIESIWSPAKLNIEYQPVVQYLARNNELLADACGRYGNTAQGLLVCLSGGDDSRRIALACKQANLGVRCVSQEVAGPDSMDEDSLVAELVAAEIGLPFRRVERPTIAASLLDFSLAPNVFNWETFQHAWALPMFRSEIASTLVFDGIGLDIAVNGHFYKKNIDFMKNWQNLDAMTELICGPPPPFSPSDFDCCGIWQTVRGELAHLPQVEHLANMFFLLNHARRATGAWHQAMYFYGHKPVAPFFHLDVFEQSLCIEPNESRAHYLQAAAQDLGSKGLGALPSTRRGVPSYLKRDLRKYEQQVWRARIATVTIRDECYDYFGISKLKVRAEMAKASFGGKRYTWRIEHLLNFTTFLNWLDCTNKN